MTDIIQVEDELRESEERMRAIFEAADSVSFIMTDLTGIEGCILEFSSGAERMFEYRCDEISVNWLRCSICGRCDKIPKVIETMGREKLDLQGSRLWSEIWGAISSSFHNLPIFDAKATQLRL